MKKSIFPVFAAVLLSGCVATGIDDETWVFYVIKDVSDIRKAYNLVDLSEYKRSISCKPDPNNGVLSEFIHDKYSLSNGYIGYESVIQRETSDLRYPFEMVKIHGADEEDKRLSAKWEIAHFRRYRPPFKWEEYDRGEIGQYAKATYKFNYIKREFEYAKIYKLALTDGGKIEEIEESVPISECLKTMEAIKKYNAQAKQNAKNIR